jgi:hypothetical protein
MGVRRFTGPLIIMENAVLICIWKRIRILERMPFLRNFGELFHHSEFLKIQPIGILAETESEVNRTFGRISFIK